VTGNGGNIVQKELNETVVRSREEIEERLETEDRQQLGDISDEVYMQYAPATHPPSEFHLRVPRDTRLYAHSLSWRGVTRREKVALFVLQSLVVSSRLIARRAVPTCLKLSEIRSAPDIHFIIVTKSFAKLLKESMFERCFSKGGLNAAFLLILRFFVYLVKRILKKNRNSTALKNFLFI